MKSIYLKLKGMFYGNSTGNKQLAGKCIRNYREYSISEEQQVKDKEDTGTKEKEDKMKKIIYAVVVFSFALMFLLLFAGLFLYLFRSFFYNP